MAKYASNNMDVINAIPKERLALSLLMVNVGSDVLPSHNVLGLAWNPNSDLYSLKVSLRDVDRWTRRTILSVMMSVHDPLGMAAPFMLPAKVLMQQLTKENADWDAEISERDRTIWQRFFAALSCLNELVMPRVYRRLTDCLSAELHCFADASKLGFGTLCHLRTFDGSSYACSFAIGKSRVCA